MPTTRRKSRPRDGTRRSMVDLELPRGVYCARPRGREYWYYQPGRGTKRAQKAVAIPGTPETPEFWTFLREVGLYQAGPTVWDMVAAWTGSQEFKALSANTQEHYRLYLRTLLDAYETRASASIGQDEILEIRERYGNAGKLVSANHFVTACRELWKWAIPRRFGTDRRLRFATENPTRDIAPYKIEAKGSEQWPDWAIALVLEKGEAQLRRGVSLLAFTGQRTVDVVAMTRDQVQDGRIAVLQVKTGKRLWVPIHPTLKPIVDEMTAACEHAFLPRRDGRTPVSADAFRAYFDRQIEKPEFKPILEAGLTLHGLRKWATSRLLEVGCTVAEVSSITGMSLAMVERYAAGRNQKAIADGAMSKWAAVDEADEAA